MPVPPKHLKELFELFSSIKGMKESEMLLTDILTPQELESLAERWQVVQKLASGKAQREIAEEFKMSISKVTRGSRALQYGSGGFGHFLKKLGKKQAK